jgi:hypothetical protein
MNKVIDAYRLERNTMGGSTMEHVVYLKEDTAKLVLEDKPNEEFVNWRVYKVKVRRINETEGAVGHELVTISNEHACDVLRARALRKLTPEERKVLGL